MCSRSWATEVNEAPCSDFPCRIENQISTWLSQEARVGVGLSFVNSRRPFADRFQLWLGLKSHLSQSGSRPDARPTWPKIKLIRKCVFPYQLLSPKAFQSGLGVPISHELFFRTKLIFIGKLNPGFCPRTWAFQFFWFVAPSEIS